MALTVTAPAESVPAEDGTLTLTVTLDPPFAQWVEARARAHGEEPGPHVATILRQYWAHHDAWRHDQAGTPTRRRGSV